MTPAEAKAYLKQIPPDELNRIVGQAGMDFDKALCERSLYNFHEHGWRYIDPAKFVSGWHLEATSEHLEAVMRGQIRRLIINQPPRTDKSSLASVALPAWSWAQKPNPDYPLLGPSVQFLYASYAQSLSVRDSVKCRRLIESPWYQERWGSRFNLTGDQNTKTRFENDQGGYRLATSVGGALTGEGGACIVADDPHNTIEAESEAIRESTLSWWDEALSTRHNDPKTGAFIIVMQRLHESDLTGHILSKNEGDWVHLMLPMRYDARRTCVTVLGFEDPRTEDGELLWPERFGEPEVVALEKSLGPYAASGQLQQSPEPRGGGIIKRDWWQVWPPEDEEQLWTRKNALGETVKSFPPFSYVLMYVDTAYTTKDENDPSACCTWGVFSHKGKPKVMLIHAWEDYLELNPLVKRVMKEASNPARKADIVVIEGKASGLSVHQEIRRLMRDGEYTLRIDDPGRMDKMARLIATESLFEGGVVYAPDTKWAEKVIDAVAKFPKGAHDDLVDCTSGGLTWLRKRGLAQLTHEVESEEVEMMRFRGNQNREPVYDV